MPERKSKSGRGQCRVGVLGGGISSEREISLLSARSVTDALNRCRIPAVMIDVDSSDPERMRNLLRKDGIGFVFIALHGEYGEDGQVQRLLGQEKMRYTGSSPSASARAMDKVCAKEVFQQHGIYTPRGRVCGDADDIGVYPEFPCVVKPSRSGSSIGVEIVEEPRGLRPAVERAAAIQKPVLIEEYVPGREVTVGILGNQALSVIEIIPRQRYYDYRAKYCDEATRFRHATDLEPERYREIQDIGLKAHRVLGCRGFSRVDVRLTNEKIPYVLEVNSIPGFTSHSLLPLSAKYSGIDFDELVVQILNQAGYGKETSQTKISAKKAQNTS
ncbi:MAG: D-alanine--D-alanine ligase [Candidatus Omnitrophica bacterium]|nr:D-alanine--D-alanine ligase [Candidatus Omnitrophota bacterium]